MRCAIYIQVSTEEQAGKEISSLDSQTDLLQRYVERRKKDGYLYSVGANGTIIVSGDDGLTWEIEDCPVSVDLHGVAGYIPIWAVGDGGSILSNEWVGGNIQPISVGKVKALFASYVEAAGATAEVKEKLIK